MNRDRQDKDKHLHRREQELKEREKALALREQALRLQQIEAELVEPEPPLYKTMKEKPSEGVLQRWLRKAKNFGLFIGIVITVAVAVKVAAWLAMGVLMLVTGWLAYKIFLRNDRSDRR
ncbi:MAG: hypothetical protein AB4290_12320 [Spirulina sp.]